MRKIILYIAMSLDGYIARLDDDLTWLDCVLQDGEDYGYQAFIDTIDTVILGKRTFDKIMTIVTIFPHINKKTYIITQTPQPNQGNLIFYTQDIENLITSLKETEGKNIYCDGGATLVNILLKKNLIDEMIISIIPILLGEGIKLFQDNKNTTNLKLIHNQTFASGLVQLHYSNNFSLNNQNNS